MFDAWEDRRLPAELLSLEDRGQDRSREIRGSGRGTGRTKQENRRSGQEQGDKIHDISGIRKRNRRTGGLDKNRGTMVQDKKQENRNRADRGLGQRTV